MCYPSTANEPISHNLTWCPAERKNTAMRQTIAEVKVESVDNLTKSRDLEMEKEHLSSEVMASNAKMNEVRSVDKKRPKARNVRVSPYS